jgi:hypothetical protein
MRHVAAGTGQRVDVRIQVPRSKVKVLNKSGEKLNKVYNTKTTKTDINGPGMAAPNMRRQVSPVHIDPQRSGALAVH